MKMTLEKVKSVVKAHEKELQNFGIRSLSVFGSVARGDSTESSDVDILVEFDGRPIGLFEFIGVSQFLEKQLGAKVDLVTIPALKKQFKDEILREAIRVA